MSFSGKLKGIIEFIDRMILSWNSFAFNEGCQLHHNFIILDNLKMAMRHAIINLFSSTKAPSEIYLSGLPQSNFEGNSFLVVQYTCTSSLQIWGWNWIRTWVRWTVWWGINEFGAETTDGFAFKWIWNPNEPWNSCWTKWSANVERLPSKRRLSSMVVITGGKFRPIWSE